jgi:hypothetical protein
MALVLPPRSAFDHIGIVVDFHHEGETFVDITRVWVTNPRLSPYNVEYLCFEPDTDVEGPLRWDPHVAYRVADVDDALKGHEVLAGPFEVGGGFCRVGFVLHDGAVIEFMQYANPDEEGWF